MRVYRIWNKKTKEFAKPARGWGRMKNLYATIGAATKAVQFSDVSKENAEIHGFELTHVTTRTNQSGGKWNAEISIDSKN